jgi:hypothetical protein
MSPTYHSKIICLVVLFLDKWFRITLRFNFSRVNISASIYPPLKQKPPLISSQNNLSNGGSSAVRTLYYALSVVYLGLLCLLVGPAFRNVIFAKWHAYSRHTSRKYCYIFLYILNLPFVILAYFVYIVV